MRTPITLGLLALAVSGLAACDSFVEDIDGPIDLVESDSLNSPEQVPFLITGVEEGFNDSYDLVASLSDLLSDIGQFDQAVDGSTFPTYLDIDNADISFDNNSVDGLYSAVNEYRFTADDLLDRATNQITFGEDEDDIRDAAIYAANFHGGIARYFLGTYFSPDETTGGAPISEDRDNPSAPLSVSELYSQADAKLAAAAAVAPSDYETRLINTLRARIALFGGDRAAAAGFAANGLVDGDAPYTGDYASTSTNNWWAQGGRGRVQISINDRFAAYDDLDDRSLVEEADKAVATDPNTYYQQALYLTNADPIPFATWQENALILAEAELFADGDDDAEALGFVNAVRASRGLTDDLTELDQAALLVERDRELFTQGQRLVDQRRFGIFHIPGGWQYFPLTQTERNANPNV